MSESNISYQRPPHIYGEILSHSIYESPRNDLPSLGRFLLQGAAVGALMAVLWPVGGMLSHPENGYNYLLVYYLPTFVGGGVLFGLCEGVSIWTCSYLVGRRIKPVARAVLGMVTLVMLIVALDYVFADPAAYYKDHSVTDYVYGLCVYAGCGVVFGLVIGSRFRPHYELIRGTTTDRWPALNGFTGLFLRVFVIVSLMVSILNLLLSLQGDFSRAEFTIAVIALSHFGVATLIIFARIPFWLLLPLTLIINLPVGVFITDVLEENESALRTLALVYLHLWAAFLFSRLSVPRWALFQEK